MWALATLLEGDIGDAHLSSVSPLVEDAAKVTMKELTGIPPFIFESGFMYNFGFKEMVRYYFRDLSAVEWIQCAQRAAGPREHTTELRTGDASTGLFLFEANVFEHVTDVFMHNAYLAATSSATYAAAFDARTTSVLTSSLSSHLPTDVLWYVEQLAARTEEEACGRWTKRNEPSPEFVGRFSSLGGFAYSN